MYYLQLIRLITIIFFLLTIKVVAEPIYHETKYPLGSEPFPAVILLHSSGGFKSNYLMNYIGNDYLNAGFAIHSPDFFKRHGITPKTRGKTWTTFRKPIENELTELVEVIKRDPKIDKKNIFAVGFSNGGYWATYLAGSKQVNAASSHYGVWNFTGGLNGYPAKYIKKDCNSLLVLHPKKDTTQPLKRVRPQINKALKKCAAVKVHYYDNGGHAWESKKYKGGAGYNKKIWKDAAKRTINFFNQNKK